MPKKGSEHTSYSRVAMGRVIADFIVGSDYFPTVAISTEDPA